MDRAKYLELRAGVAYWEDATLDGQEDTNGAMPCRKGRFWAPIIELSTGRVLGWPAGVVASINYKVSDNGEYWLLDAHKKRIAKWCDYYVPNELLCIGENGWGDYIILDISADGHIKEWAPKIVSAEWQPLAEAERVASSAEADSCEGTVPASLEHRIAEAASNYKRGTQNEDFAKERGGVDALRNTLFDLLVAWEAEGSR